MKNLFKSMLLVAVAAMGFTACSKEAVEEVNPAIQDTFTLTISAEKPALESESRTEFVDGAVIWSGVEKIRACYYHSTGVWSRYYASNQTPEIAADGSTAIFTIDTEFPAADGEGEYTFYAGYPQNAIGSGTAAPAEGVLAVTVPTEQSMTKFGTFDANADIMVGQSYETYTEVSQSVPFRYTRLVAHGCVTLKNLAAEEGEVVKTVTFTAPEDVLLTGAGEVNFVEQSMSELDNNTVTVAMPANTAADAAELTVWFCSAPATIASGEDLTVTVETTRGTYTRTITAREEGVNFLQNRYNTLGINMATAEFEAAAVSANVYQIITSTAELTSGEYVFAGLYNDNYYPMQANFTSTKINATNTITVNKGQITEADAEGYVITLTVSTDGISIFDGTYYLAYNSSTNFKTNNTTAAYWTATYEDGKFKIIANSTTRAILWQYNNGTSRFAPYATSNFSSTDYSGLYLFKKMANDPTAPTLSLDKSELTFVQAGGSQTITATTTNFTGTITAESDNAHFTTSVSGNVITVTAPANTEATAQTATITITAGTVSKSVMVSQAGDLPGTGEGTLESPYDVTRALAAIDADADETVENVYVKGTITSIDEVSTQYGNATYYIDNDLEVFRGKYLENVKFTSEDQIHEGDEVVVYGNLTLYNGTTYEFAANNYIVSLNCSHGEGGEEPEDPEIPGDDTTAYYTKVTSTPTDWSGTYLIVYEDGNKAFNGGLSNKLDVTSNYTDVTISNGRIEATEAMDNICFTIAKDSDGYTFKSASGLYMGQTSDANGLQSNSSTSYTNTITLNTDDGSVNIISGGAYLRYNKTSGQDRFRYYKSGTYTSQQAVALYKKN